jgi:hypothetical protein
VALVPSEKDRRFRDADLWEGTNVLGQRGNLIGLPVKVLWLLAKTLRQGNKMLCLVVKALCPRDVDL